jgi:hypothetical protein
MSFWNSSESIYQTVWPRINFNMTLLPSKKRDGHFHPSRLAARDLSADRFQPFDQAINLRARIGLRYADEKIIWAI